MWGGRIPGSPAPFLTHGQAVSWDATKQRIDSAHAVALHRVHGQHCAARAAHAGHAAAATHALQQHKGRAAVLRTELGAATQAEAEAASAREAIEDAYRETAVLFDELAAEQRRRAAAGVASVVGLWRHRELAAAWWQWRTALHLERHQELHLAALRSQREEAAAAHRAAVDGEAAALRAAHGDALRTVHARPIYKEGGCHASSPPRFVASPERCRTHHQHGYQQTQHQRRAGPQGSPLRASPRRQRVPSRRTRASVALVPAAPGRRPAPLPPTLL